VLDIATQKVVAKVATGLKPNGISFSSLLPAMAETDIVTYELTGGEGQEGGAVHDAHHEP
jgi:hypothetical protein